MRSLLALISITLVGASCSPFALTKPIFVDPSPADPSVTNSKPADPTSPALMTPVATFSASPTANAAARKYTDLAKQDLAARLNIAQGQISLLQISALTAADPYAGCTLKLSQALMPNDSAVGYQITLEAQGQVYLYHTGSDKAFLCQGPPSATGPLKPLPHALTQVPPTGP